MPDERGKGGQSPTIDKAVEQEYNALRDFLARLESTRRPQPSTGEGPRAGVKVIGTEPEADAGVRVPEPPRRAKTPAPPSRPVPEPVIYWWVTLRDIPLLPRVAALRERLAGLPGTIEAQVVDLSSRDIRLGVTTTPQVTLQQLEFAVTACHDINGAEVSMHIPGRAR